MLNFIYPNATKFSIYTFKKLYCSFEKSLLEYYSERTPCCNTHVYMIERVQRKFFEDCSLNVDIFGKTIIMRFLPNSILKRYNRENMWLICVFHIKLLTALSSVLN